MDLPGIDITKLKLKCGAVIATTVPSRDNVHTIVVSHTCDGDKGHDADNCVCKCGFYWQKQPKDSIGE